MTENEFVSELKKININISQLQLSQLKMYYELLVEWNEKINLTRIINREDVYLKHFYDSATIIKVIDINNISSLCDFGTGAGFPGIVLKIIFPHLNITLLDSLNKRINFLNLVIKKLNLENIVAIHTRVEDYGKIYREKYDCVVARAVASLNILIEYAVPLVKVNKYFIAMKANIEDELKNSSKAMEKLSIKLKCCEQFYLPKEKSIRNILLFVKNKETQKKYPRLSSEIKKNPL